MKVKLMFLVIRCRWNIENHYLMKGHPNPAAEFSTAESGPVGRQASPDDYELDVDEIGGSSISDLDSDVSKLKEFATGKGPNPERDGAEYKKEKTKPHE
jgi:hypothetical protein